MTLISDVKKAREATFHMEDRGRLYWFVGLRIRWEEVKVTIDQERFIETKLERIQMHHCKPSRSPADLNLKLQKAQNEDQEVDQTIYRSLFGSLLYLAKQTRPDIIFTVNILSRHMNAPTQSTLTMRKTTSAISSRLKKFKYSYCQNGCRHLHETLTRIGSGNIQNCFNGNRLYAFSSSLSGGPACSTSARVF